MGRQSKCDVPEETPACSPARLVMAVFRQQIGRGAVEGLVSGRAPSFLLALEQRPSRSRSKEHPGISVKGRDGLDLMLDVKHGVDRGWCHYEWPIRSIILLMWWRLHSRCIILVSFS